MSLIMRPYQQKAIDEVYFQWGSGKQFVVLVAPTGSGKAAMLCEIARIEAERGQRVLITAHRSELISQLSNTLARNGLRHKIIAAQNTIKYAARLHMEDHGQCFYDPTSKVTVASIQSMKEHDVKALAQFRDRLTVIGDEFHHYTKDSKTWGGVFTPLVEAGARGLGPTATPCRADGKGLSRETDGYGDAIVICSSMRELINAGYLSDYRIYCPPSDLHLERVKVSATTGDYAERELKQEIGKSHIVGDIVEHYLRIAPGKRGVTFTVGVDMAEQVAEAYRSKGVPAVAVSGRMDDADRVKALRDVASGKVLQLVNDSVLTEGTDIAAIEVISFARPTQSYALYCQMFGRGTRISPATGKNGFIVIDHVGNVTRHGLPDAPREWSLDRRERRSAGKSDAVPVRICVKCTSVYERFMDACPYCGEPIPAPAQRTAIEFVDGDLFELDAATLAQLRGEVAKVDMPVGELRSQLQAKHMPHLGILAQTKRHIERQEAVAVLRDTMAHWAGYERHAGLSDSEIYRKFYLRFGVDMIGAQTLKAGEMEELNRKIVLDRPAIAV